MWTNPHGTADLVTFTEEILTGRLKLERLKWSFFTIPLVAYELTSAYKNMFKADNKKNTRTLSSFSE